MQKDREIESKIKSKVYFCSLDKVLKGEAPLMFENHEGSNKVHIGHSKGANLMPIESQCIGIQNSINT